MARFTVTYRYGPLDGEVYHMDRAPQENEERTLDIHRSGIRHTYAYSFVHRAFIHWRVERMADVQK